MDAETLGSALPKEQARVREVLGRYKEIGSSGVGGAVIIEQLLQRTDKAVIEGDLAAMIGCYKELKEVE